MLLFIFILFASPIFSQDSIELPDVELILEDQSTINSTIVAEDALLRDRNPEFQEVFLEELSANLMQNASFDLVQTQRYIRQSFIDFSYGSFHNTIFNALLQNMNNNVFYKISYHGQFVDDRLFNNTRYNNTSSISNVVNAHASTVLSNMQVAVDFSYNHKEQSFFQNNHSQKIHYFPLTGILDYWITSTSYFHSQINFGIGQQSIHDISGNLVHDPLIIDGGLELAYRANFSDWNYFEIASEYEIHSYQNNQLSHMGVVSIISDFIIGKGFSTKIGATVVASSTTEFFGWPEFVLAYNYHNLFTIDLSISGSSDLIDGYDIFKQKQSFNNSPLAEEQWIYALTTKVMKSPYFWFGAKVAYKDYRNKRLYQFNEGSQLYSFKQSKEALLQFEIMTELQYKNIISLLLSYQYQNVPNTWLLETEHRFDTILGLGYKPVGFWTETSLALLSPITILSGTKTSINTLLSFKIKQSVHKKATLFLELDNILNQNIRLTEALYYGGFQARGGIELRF